MNLSGNVLFLFFLIQQRLRLGKNDSASFFHTAHPDIAGKAAQKSQQQNTFQNKQKTFLGKWNESYELVVASYVDRSLQFNVSGIKKETESKRKRRGQQAFQEGKRRQEQKRQSFKKLYRLRQEKRSFRKADAAR